MKDNKNYVKVYFRIDNDYGITDNTGMSIGWKNDEAKEVFNIECKDLFDSLGFTTKEGKKSGYCNEVYGEGLNYLYLHPQGFSGVLEINDELQKTNTIEQCNFIKTIRDMILSKNYKQIKLRWIDFGIRKDFSINEVVKNYDKEDLINELNNQKEDIINQIFLKTTTSRSNLYKRYSYQLISYKHYDLKGINIDGDYEQEKKLEKVINKYFQELLEQLINEGKLKVFNDNYIQNQYNIKHYRELLKSISLKSVFNCI